MTQRGGAVTTALATVATQYVGVVIGAINTVIVARAIGASGRGAVGYVVVVAISALAIAHLSVGPALLRGWSTSNDRQRMVGASLVIALVAGSVLAAIGAALSLADLFDFPPGVDPWMVPAALALLPFKMTVLYTKSALTNEGRFRALNGADVLTSVLHLVVLMALWATSNLTIATVLVAWMIASAVPVPLLVAAIARHLGVRRPTIHAIWVLAATGLRFHLGHLALALVLRVDVLLLASRVSVAQLGIYSLAVTLAELAWTVTNSIAQVAVQFQLTDEPEDVAATTAYVFRVNLMVAATVVLGAIVIGPVAIPLVFGASFAGTTGALLALALGVVSLAAHRPLYFHLARVASPWLITAPMVIALAVNVGLNLVLIPRHGIIGAGAASSAAYLLLAVWFVVWFRRSTELEPRQLVPRPSDLRPLVATLRNARAMWTSP